MPPARQGRRWGLLLHGLGALSLRSLCQLCALGAAVAARWLLPQKFMPAALAGCGTLTGMALCFALGSSGGRPFTVQCGRRPACGGHRLRAAQICPGAPGHGHAAGGCSRGGGAGQCAVGLVLARGAGVCRRRAGAVLPGAKTCRPERQRGAGGSSLRRRPCPCPGGSGAWLRHGSGGGAGTRAAGGDPCRLRGRVCIRGTLRAAARKRLWAAVQRLRRHGGGLSTARRLACPGSRHPAERGKRSPRPPAVRRRPPGWKPWHRAFPHWQKR